MILLSHVDFGHFRKGKRRAQCNISLFPHCCHWDSTHHLSNKSYNMIKFCFCGEIE